MMTYAILQYTGRLQRYGKYMCDAAQQPKHRKQKEIATVAFRQGIMWRDWGLGDASLLAFLGLHGSHMIQNDTL